MAAPRGIGITIDGLERLGADLSRLERPGLRLAIERALRGPGGEALAAEMRLRSPRRTGRLVGGIGVRSSGVGADVEVGFAGDDRGVFVESGARPHVIRARDGGSLTFGGRHVEEVNHPGMRGRKVAHRSIRAAQWEVEGAVVDEINRILGGVG